MAVFVLPNQQRVPVYEFQVQLDGVYFRMLFTFNEIENFWYMDLFNGATNAALRRGLKIVSQWDLLRLYKSQARPAGNLVAIPQGPDGMEAKTLSALGLDVLLTYSGQS